MKLLRRREGCLIECQRYNPRLLDVLRDRLGYQVVDSVTFAATLSTLGGGDRKSRHLDQRDAARAARVGQFVSGPGDAYQVGEPKHLRRVPADKYDCGASAPVMKYRSTPSPYRVADRARYPPCRWDPPLSMSTRETLNRRIRHRRAWSSGYRSCAGLTLVGSLLPGIARRHETPLRRAKCSAVAAATRRPLMDRISVPPITPTWRRAEVTGSGALSGRCSDVTRKSGEQHDKSRMP